MPITLPRQNCIIFQLLSFPKNNPDKLKEVDVVSMEVIPTSISYDFTNRDAVYQTSDNIFTDKFPMAPIRCSLDGSFGGALPRLAQLSLNNGFTRMKAIELLFRRSKSTNDKKLYEDYIIRQGLSDRNYKDDGSMVYVLNYYDFIFQQFFSINMQTLKVMGNAKMNTQMQYYSLNFISSGKLYDVKTTDPLLMVLTEAQKLLLISARYMNDTLEFLLNNPYVRGLQVAYFGTVVAVELAYSIYEVVNQLKSSALNQTKAEQLLPIY